MTTPVSRASRTGRQTSGSSPRTPLTPGTAFTGSVPGINHLAFWVARRDDVDRFRDEFLLARGLPVLYGTPREFPEYRPGYYAVFFEDPDRLKLEVAHVPGARSH